MPIQQKTIKVIFYQVSTNIYKKTNTSNESVICSNESTEFHRVLKCLSTLDVMSRRWPSTNDYDEIRLQELEKVTSNHNNYWKMQFIRVRTSDRPKKVDNQGEYTEIELNDDEYVGEDVTCLYDSVTNVIAIQQNYHSVRASRIEQYFTDLYKRQIQDENFANFAFHPIIDSAIEQYDDAIIKSLELTCIDLNNADLKSVVENKNGFFGAQKINLKLGLNTRKQKSTLNVKNIFVYIKNCIKNHSMTKIRARVKLSPELPVETVDFLQYRLQIQFKLSFSKDNEITHSRIWGEMISKCPPLINKISQK